MQPGLSWKRSAPIRGNLARTVASVLAHKKTGPRFRIQDTRQESRTKTACCRAPGEYAGSASVGTKTLIARMDKSRILIRCNQHRVFDNSMFIHMSHHDEYDSTTRQPKIAGLVESRNAVIAFTTLLPVRCTSTLCIQYSVLSQLTSMRRMQMNLGH